MLCVCYVLSCGSYLGAIICSWAPVCRCRGTERLSLEMVVVSVQRLTNIHKRPLDEDKWARDWRSWSSTSVVLLSRNPPESARAHAWVAWCRGAAVDMQAPPPTVGVAGTLVQRRACLPAADRLCHSGSTDGSYVSCEDWTYK
jgi:hypothetical protein